MKIKNVLDEAAQKLSSVGIESPRLDAEVLLMNLLEKDRVFLYTHPEFECPEEIRVLYKAQIKERIRRKPLAYITNSKEFMGLDFYVDENVLIPRPDTEALVETVLEMAKECPRVLDLGAGSGAIGLSIKVYRPLADVVLSDVSERALDVARCNSRRLGLESTCIMSDLFENISGTFDVIISNPPYIEREEIESLEDEIRIWEPRTALDGGEDGFDFYRKIIENARDFLTDGGLLILEAGDHQSEGLLELLKKSGYTEVGFRRDLTGTARVVYGRFVSE